MANLKTSSGKKVTMVKSQMTAPQPRPLRVHGDQRRHQLRGEEGGHQEQARPLHEEPTPGARHEDERLADDAHLEVHRRHQLLRAVADVPHPERILRVQIN
jgi:hypothetical protein